MANVLEQINANVILVINLKMDRKVFVNQFASFHVKMQDVLNQMSVCVQIVFRWPMKVSRMNVIVVCIALKSMVIVIV